MTARDLLDTLLYAEHEDQVVALLDASGYPIENNEVWLPLGRNEGNFSTVGNQQENAAAAFVEKVVNSIDAVLLAECYRRGIDPESASAPATMQEAVELFFGARGGRLDNLSKTQRTELADRIHVIATGEKQSPSYCIVDRGEGQTPNQFPDTFCSTTRSSPKIRINFVQGKFNAGGTGSLQFCGRQNLQLILSRRQPFAPAIGDSSRDQWGFTVIRRRRPRMGERGSVFVYLAPGGIVPRFSADSLPLLPGKSGVNSPAPAYAEPLDYGTCVKLYSYQWKGRGTATLETRRNLERALHSPALPFRVSETRKDYKANYYATTVVGVWNQISVDKGDAEDQRTMESGFPAPATISLRGIGELPIRIGVWKDTVDTKNFPTGVYFLVNGQVHGQFGEDFASRRLKFDYIRDHLLVSVDCTGIDRSVAEDLFMASRDRLRKNDHYDEIRDALAAKLSEHQGLRDLNAARRKERAENSGDASSVMVNLINDMIRRDPGFADLFGAGARLITSTGPGLPPPFKGRKFPTYFRLEKEPRAGALRKPCPANRTVRVVFETDAENEYFSRASDPGELSVDPSPDLIESSALWNGKFVTHFRVPWNSRVGDLTKVRVLVSDIERTPKGPFVADFELLTAQEEGSRPKKTSPSPRPSGNPRSPSSGGRTASLELPNPIEVRKAEWNKHGFDGPYDALRIQQRPDEGYDFFVNVDHAQLLTEMTDRRNDPALMKHWFKWGLALAAVGMLRHQSDSAAKVDDGAETFEVPDIKLISKACDGFARVIIPMMRVLHEGPPPEV
jgi:hypothetical protein